MGDERDEVPQDAMMQMLTAMREEMRNMGEQVGTLRTEFGVRIGRLEQPRPAPARGVPLQLGQLTDDDMPELENDPPDPLHRQHRRRADPLQRNPAREVEERGQNHDIKLTPPTFAGKSNPEVYMDWEIRLEHIFECYGYNEHKKVAVAAAQLKDNAFAWWDRNVAERRRQRFGPVATWSDMKFLLRLRSVDEYFEEFEKLMNSLELEESKEALMAQFIDGLQERIAWKVERAQYSGLHELLHLSVQVEQQIKRKTSLNQRNRTSQPWTSSSSKPVDKGKAVEIDSRFKGKGNENSKFTRPEQGKSSINDSRTRDIVYFKCQGRGHMSRDCPNRRVMIITSTGDYESEEEQEDEQSFLDDEVEYSDKGELLVTRRVLSVLVNPAEKAQRENLFHTRCTINGKVCNLVIDGGSCTNVASEFLVDRLGLEKTKHPKLYPLQWLNEEVEMKVREQVVVPFSVGRYQDQVTCDILPMHAGHLLLGRPWQFDRQGVVCIAISHGDMETLPSV
ncbi:unnamed protein product [Microthlaspi erraticum]|uniref:CCHC-type domain-containing protein n=1 Tax=Microthlaspi erraticum TaxID=1685480 RepID=A0A6D2JKD4_9BRAS|nr:unnamed protein product [Microthlaspi erraticum]